MSTASRLMGTTAGLLCLLIAVQCFGLASASPWSGLRSLVGGGDAEHRHARAQVDQRQVEQVVPAGQSHPVHGAAGSADMQLRRSEQERAVARPTYTSGGLRARFLSGNVQAVKFVPTGLRSPTQTCDKTPALCKTPENIASGKTTCCNKKCVNILSDSNNCGACSVVVGKGCVCCTGKVANLKKDVNNCGKCGNVCKGPKPVCSYSICNYNTGPF